MAKKQNSTVTKSPKTRAEKPLPAGRIEEAAARAGIATPTIDSALDAQEAAEKARTKASYAAAGIPFVDYPASANERSMRLEKKALASTESDSLRSRIMRILRAGAYVEDDPEHATTCTAERALLRYAAATTKAAGLALMGAEYVDSNHNFEMEFTDEDAAIVMCGLSELLEAGPELIDSIESADRERLRAGGAS